jgi:hypothetical protein
LVQFHTVLDDTSHECWYSSTQYWMTHHMNVGTVPHSTGWHITWMLVQFHTVPDDTTSHECWYSSTQYQMTQHHMNVGTVPHSTGWHITWMSVQFHTLPHDTTSHECSATQLGDLNCCTAIYCFIATCYCILRTDWAAVMVLKCFVLVLPIVWIKSVEYLDKYNTLHLCLHLQVEAKVICEGIL